MAQYFLESSALAKRYKQETGTSFVNKLFLNPQNKLFYLNLAVVEIRKIFYRLWMYPQTFENDVQINDDDFRSLESRFYADIQKMTRIDFTQDMIDKANDILEKQWLKSVFDLVHLSSYLIITQDYPEMIFVCSDKRSNLINASRQFIPDQKIIVPEMTY